MNFETNKLIDLLLRENQLKSLDIKTAYNLFMNYINLYKRKGTELYYKSVLKPVLNHFYINDIRETKEITNNVINDYINKRKYIVKNITINKEIISLKIMLHYLIKQKYLNELNFTFDKLETEKTTIPRIEKNDIKKIITYLNESNIIITNKLIFYLILTTGIRTNELIHIKNKNIDIENSKILLDFTKNKRPRYIFLVPYVKELILKCINKNEFLFNLKESAIRTLFRRLKNALNINVLSPHKLRHYYATNIYNKSKDIRLVKELLGHQEITTTQIYLDVDTKEIQQHNKIYNPLNDFL